MIPAVARTLANILAKGTSLSSTEHIDLNPPGPRVTGRSGLTLYCYDVCKSSQVHAESLVPSIEKTQLTNEQYLLQWFDVSFLVSAWDYTVLGEQQLLSEALTSLVGHPSLPEEMLAPELRGHGDLPLVISLQPAINPVMLWTSLGVPLRPALYVTVSIPVFSERKPIAFEEISPSVTCSNA
ncbi:hypothetical protein BST81_19530 [Leptolyngbya sp. 'hensonii']|uniref:Pvc16 family protein n=1 Tax=Leptolyngbya sp. 'hensonii' TaxID=1922337 RepID=UPI00094FF357|nr:Pvc16 family protein [Leptolyngbya sp. 'hensonii']OLP16633.1 hypothetical protein BST81_19530 [Leptolyngbya sp. 'hensonii']